MIGSRYLVRRSWNTWNKSLLTWPKISLVFFNVSCIHHKFYLCLCTLHHTKKRFINTQRSMINWDWHSPFTWNKRYPNQWIIRNIKQMCSSTLKLTNMSSIQTLGNEITNVLCTCKLMFIIISIQSLGNYNMCSHASCSWLLEVWVWIHNCHLKIKQKKYA